MPFEIMGQEKKISPQKWEAPLCSGTPSHLARKQQALGATPTSSSCEGLVGSLGFGAHFTDLIMSNQVALPGGKTRKSCSLNFCHISALLQGLFWAQVCPGGWAPQPFPAPGRVSDPHACPHGDEWVAPVLQGQDRRLLWLWWQSSHPPRQVLMTTVEW